MLTDYHGKGHMVRNRVPGEQKVTAGQPPAESCGSQSYSNAEEVHPGAARVRREVATPLVKPPDEDTAPLALCNPLRDLMQKTCLSLAESASPQKLQGNEWVRLHGTKSVVPCYTAVNTKTQHNHHLALGMSRDAHNYRPVYSTAAFEPC